MQMHAGITRGVFAAVAATVIVAALAAPAHAQTAVCSSCHPAESRAWSETGMAKSLHRPKPGGNYTTSSPFYHKPSGIWYEMIERNGRYIQRQYQTGPDGGRINETEKEVDFVLGSGNHARTFLHLNPDNTLAQLPFGWYAENGGVWGMNPGYDRPNHEGIRRRVTYDCMFCHNAYPAIPASNAEPRSLPVFSSIPEGIDCQRCHGDGTQHAEMARRGIRSPIVNPSALDSAQQMELCMQCHLETTSSPLPASIVRYERSPFSYRAGEPLADFMLHFDHAKGTGRDDKFEITGSVYRLRQSRCFLESNGALTCTTCHDLHGAPKNYSAVCLQCHANIASASHPASDDCASCHMPKRRTDDVVHAVMTDHLIQRPGRAAGTTARVDYRGEVALYYPRALPRPEDELYLAIAQVAQGANLTQGIARLKTALDKYRPARAEYYLQYGDALRSAGRSGEALAAYEEAVRQEPESAIALERLALANRNASAETLLNRLLQATPGSAQLWLELGLTQLGERKTAEAIASFVNSTRRDPDMVEAWNSAGATRFENGDASQAETELRAAIRVQPNFAPAHNNLGNLLSMTDRFAEAKLHFEEALRLQENYAGAHYNYALALTRVHRLPEAQTQVEEVLRIEPRSAEAHEFLGTLLSAQGQTARAIDEYREALRIEPQFSQAIRDLAESQKKK